MCSDTLADFYELLEPYLYRIKKGDRQKAEAKTF